MSDTAARSLASSLRGCAEHALQLEYRLERAEDRARDAETVIAAVQAEGREWRDRALAAEAKVDAWEPIVKAACEFDGATGWAVHAAVAALPAGMRPQP